MSVIFKTVLRSSGEWFWKMCYLLINIDVRCDVERMGRVGRGKCGVLVDTTLHNELVKSFG